MEYKEKIFRAKKNGRFVYVSVRCPPEFINMANADGYIFEHRLVMAKYIGRCLRKNEHVHHIDGNTQNNGMENLKIMPPGRHVSLHMIKTKEKKIVNYIKKHGDRTCDVCGANISFGKYYEYRGNMFDIYGICPTCMSDIKHNFKYIKYFSRKLSELAQYNNKNNNKEKLSLGDIGERS